MDAVSPITSTPISNVIAGLGASGISSNRANSSVTALAPDPSVRVRFSAFVTNLLAQQANDPSQSIDVALARSLAGLTPDAATGGQLYNASGLLQQLATAQLLAQQDGTGEVSAQSLTDISEAARQAALANSAVLLGQTAQSAPLVAPTPFTTMASVNPVTDSDIPVATPDAVIPIEVAAVPLAETTTAVAADAQAANVTVEAAIPFPNPNEPLLFDKVDPYRQAALISGLTAFGKEQSDYIQAASEAVTAAAVGAVTAVSANRTLMNESDEAAANALA